jgi:outer membrane protein TolC
LSSEYELRGYAEALIAQVETAYWQYALRAPVGDLRGRVRVAEQQLADTEGRVAVGKMADVELAAARAEVASRREGLIAADSGREKARLDLLRLLNPPAPIFGIATSCCRICRTTPAGRLDRWGNTSRSRCGSGPNSTRPG